MNKKSKEQEIILENDKHENIFIKGYRTQIKNQANHLQMQYLKSETKTEKLLTH